MQSIGRLWRTVRWLKVRQIVGRVRFRLQRPMLDLRPAPARRPAAGTWQLPARREASMQGAGAMHFLGVTRDLDRWGWDSPELPLLWRYNQHYFDDLNAQGAPARLDWHRSLLRRWLAENPPGRGTAWAPYPLSLRLVNWCKWFLGGQAPEAAWLDSLAAQARWLMQRLEWHLLGNHLFINAKALVFAGLFFEGPEAERWLGCGLAILEQELPEQFLDDGGQFERSPMYHALAVEDLLDLVQVIEHLAPGQAPVRRLLPELRTRASKALWWMRCMAHGDRSLVRFNDTAEGIAPCAAELERVAQCLQIEAPQPPASGAVHLAATGYARLARGPALLFLDVARIGPDYLPGHAHADTLSFELSLCGQPILINRGTSEYGTGPRRMVERGTAAHNTVQCGAHDSSEVWSGFRVGRRARPRDVEVRDDGVQAAHDGYLHLPGKPLHRRRWQLSSKGLQVDDTVEPLAGSTTLERAVARFHLHPGLQLQPSGPKRWQVLRGADCLVTVEVTQGQADIERWEQALRFGELAPALTLAVCLEQGQSTVRWQWPPTQDN